MTSNAKDIFLKHKKNAVKALTIILPFVLVTLMYSNILRAPFLFDDLPHIPNNPNIKITSLHVQDLVDVGTKSRLSNRPIAYITFALNYYFGGYNPFGYHLVNIIIHLITGLILFFLIRETIERSGKVSSRLLVTEDTNASYIAFAAVLIWLAHPLHTQSVTYTVQRMNSMAAMFYLLAMLCYVRARLGEGWRKYALYASCVVSGALAVGSKEIAATLPVFIFLYEWYFFRDLDRDWLKRQVLPLAGVVFVFAIVALVYVGGDPVASILRAYNTRDFTIGQRVLTEFRVVMLYISLLFFPYPGRLNLDYDFPISHTLLSPATTLLSILGVVFLVVFAVYMAKKDRIVSFAILWFLGNLAMESSVIGLELVYEHRTYLPSMFVVLAAVLLVHRYVRARWVGYAVLCAVVLAGSLWTYQRNNVWKDEVSFWQDNVTKSPHKARPRANLGNALAKIKRYSEAIAQYQESIKIDPNNWVVYNNLGKAFTENGQIREAFEQFSKGLEMKKENDLETRALYFNIAKAYEKISDSDQAMNNYGLALKVDPNYVEAHLDLGILLAKNGKYASAIQHFNYALYLDPRMQLVHNNIGNTHMAMGNIDLAVNEYMSEIKTNPAYADSYNNLGIAYYKQGKIAEAISQFKKAVELNENYSKAKNNLIQAQAKKREIDSSIKRLNESIRQDPNNYELHFRLAQVYLQNWDMEKAIEQYNSSLSIKPEFIQAMYGLAVIYSKSGEYDKSLDYLKRMAQIQPDNPEIFYNIACVYSLQNNVDESMRWIREAIGKGFNNWGLLETDKDLENLRATDYYKKIAKAAF